MLPDLNRLQVFYHVYALKSVNKAAIRLQLTQPAVSQQIKKLENEIRAELFTRLHRKIVPTSAGHRLFRVIKPFMSSIDSHVRYITMPLNAPHGPLSIGAPLEFGITYLPKICKAFRKKHSTVTFGIELEESDVLLSRVKKGALDFALVDFFSAKDQFPGKPDLFHIDPLVEETFILACSREYHDKYIKGDYSFENIEKQAFLTDEHEPMILKHWFWHHYARIPANLDIVLAIDNHQALLAAIRLGMGLAITATHLVAEEIRAGGICVVAAGQKEIISNISLVQLADKTATLTETSFQEHLRKWLSRDPDTAGHTTGGK